MVGMSKHSTRRVIWVAAVQRAYACLRVSSVSAAGLVTVSDAAWDESSVRRVLHVFAYGCAATDTQIEYPAGMKRITGSFSP
jgi:hypothetical protein